MTLIHIVVTFLLSNFIGCIDCQHCVQTQLQTNWKHPCPPLPPVFMYKEAFTLERHFPNGTKRYLKLCCDPKGVEMLRAHATGCHTTRCLPKLHANYTKPCSSFRGRFVVDGTYVSYEEQMRETCAHEETASPGIAVVCCPPKSKAKLLLSLYGVEENEFPHQGRLQSGQELCGATVYNKDYLITAAHCVVDKQGNAKDPTKTHVVLGTNIGNLKSKTNTYPVEKIIVHERYSLLSNSSEFRHVFPFKRIFNDIALIKLATPINFKKHSKIRALPIAPPNCIPTNHGNHVVIIGWGITDAGGLSENLQKANFRIHSDSECFKPLLGYRRDILPYPNTRELSEQLICVGGILNGDAGPVAARGDSGGPAICRAEGGDAVHCGITSFGGSGELCAQRVDDLSCRPTVIADVSYFRDWVIRYAGGQDPSSLHKVKLFGVDVPPSEALHQVRITSSTGAPCGGTLVSHDTVVTAAHCVFSAINKVRPEVQISTRDGKMFRIRTLKNGVTGLSTFKRQAFLDKLIERQSGAKSFVEPPFQDDIAVVRLEGNVSYSPDKLPQLPIGDMHEAFQAKEYSQPYLKMGAKGSNNQLMQRDYHILNAKECQRRLDTYKGIGVAANFDLSRTLCGVEVFSGGSTCDRFLGGGVICQDKILCGVQVFRFCDSSMPTMFVNVAKYLNVIEKAMKS